MTTTKLPVAGIERALDASKELQSMALINLPRETSAGIGATPVAVSVHGSAGGAASSTDCTRTLPLGNRNEDQAIIVVDNAGLVVNLSAAAERIHGWSASDIVGKHFSLFHVPDPSELDRHQRELDRAAHSGRLELETERVRKDGTRFLAEVVITVLRGSDGKLSGFAKVVREISARRPLPAAVDVVAELAPTPGRGARSDVDEKVRVSEIRYRRLFEAAQDGVLLLDPDTRKITDANPFILNLLEYSLGELVGRELFEIGLLRDEAASREMFERLRRNDQVRYEDLPLASRTGRHQEVEVVANVYDENGPGRVRMRGEGAAWTAG